MPSTAMSMSMSMAMATATATRVHADSSGWSALGSCTTDNDCFGGVAGFVCVDLDGNTISVCGYPAKTGRCSCNTEADGCGNDQTCAPAQLPN